MEVNTVLLELEKYQELLSFENLYDNLLMNDNEAVEEILNGNTVQLLDDEHFKTPTGHEFVVRRGCKFYSATDTTIALKKQLQLANECGEAAMKRIEELKSRTLLDFLLRRNR